MSSKVNASVPRSVVLSQALDCTMGARSFLPAAENGTVDRASRSAAPSSFPCAQTFASGDAATPLNFGSAPTLARPSIVPRANEGRAFPAGVERVSATILISPIRSLPILPKILCKRSLLWSVSEVHF